MKVRFSREILYSDINEEFNLSLPAMFRLFQDISAYHSELIDFGIENLSQKGISWMLVKLGLAVYRSAKYREILEILSWSRGASGFKMLRDFQIFANGELIAGGSSVWLLVNQISKKVERIPPEIEEGYQTEPQKALESGIESWSSYQKFEPEHVCQLKPRLTDLDQTGHVNNSYYCEYVLHALVDWGKAAKWVSLIKFQFSREIGRNIREVNIGLARKNESTILFKIFGDTQLFARGNIMLQA